MRPYFLTIETFLVQPEPRLRMVRLRQTALVPCTQAPLQIPANSQASPPAPLPRRGEPLWKKMRTFIYVSYFVVLFFNLGISANGMNLDLTDVFTTETRSTEKHGENLHNTPCFSMASVSPWLIQTISSPFRKIYPGAALPRIKAKSVFYPLKSVRSAFPACHSACPPDGRQASPS
jgi:hypothetical protein